MTITKLLPLIFVGLVISPNQAYAATPDYYKCINKEGGEWNYGRVPNVCSASSFGSDATILADYPLLIFADKVSRTPERSRYVTEMYSLVRDAADYYMRKRKPTVSAEEMSKWKLLVQMTAAHETRMSHYRHTSDSRLKMMRGDLGHGHGMMQIDDRAHFDAITSGIAWNLITNLTYAMDILYTEWQRAPAQSCYKSATDKWKARTRSAWEAFNGGSGSICRWANTKSVWRENDDNFLHMYTNQTWKSYLLTSTAPASVDTACLIENHENCASPGSDTSLVPLNLYQRPDKSVCTVIAGRFQCVAQSRDAICLRALGNVNMAAATAISSTVAASLPVTVHDRHLLCEKYDNSLMGVGSFLKTVVAINVRSTPGGGLLTTIPKDKVVDILDFEVRNHLINDRYYKVKSGTTTGYIYSGTVNTHPNWAVPTAPPVVVPATVVPPGKMLTVVAANGINLRATAGGTFIILVPRLTQLTVLDFVIRDSDNEVYYLVDYKGHRGYIYSGHLLPTSSTSTWTKVIP